MVKKIAIILGFVILTASNGFAEEARIVKANDVEGVILFQEKIPQLSELDANAKEYWTPSVQDAFTADELAETHLMKYSDEQSIMDILGNLSNYKRQYVGFIGDNGDRIVYINYFYDDGSFSYWKEEWVSVLDGGSHFFQIKVNLNKKECFDLSINGEA